MTRPVEVKKFKAPNAPYDRNALHYPSDTCSIMFYEPLEPFTVLDVCKPGHFNAYWEDLRVGKLITCLLGEIADGINMVELQVIECPRNAHSKHTGDVMVSRKGRDGKFTPYRHDGTMTDEKERKAA